jgi:hypothetical protein
MQIFVKGDRESLSIFRQADQEKTGGHMFLPFFPPRFRPKSLLLPFSVSRPRFPPRFVDLIASLEDGFLFWRPLGSIRSALIGLPQISLRFS